MSGSGHKKIFFRPFGCQFDLKISGALMRNFISCYYSELITSIALEKSKKKKKNAIFKNYFGTAS